MEAAPVAVAERVRDDHVERLAHRLLDAEQGRRARTPVADDAGGVDHDDGR
jgi:hypothetical protein